MPGSMTAGISVTTLFFPKFQLNAFWNSYILQQFCDNRSLFFLPHTLKILIGFNCLQDIFNFFNR